MWLTAVFVGLPSQSVQKLAKSRGIKAAHWSDSTLHPVQINPARPLLTLSTKRAVMMVKYTVCCLLLVSLLSVTVQAVEKAAEATDKVDQTPAGSTTTSTSSPASSDVGFPNNMIKTLTNGGMVAIGAAAVLAILAALAMPLFGFQYCQLLGTCNNSAYTGYNNMYQNDVYSQYPSSSYQTGNTYQKRSVDYMGPMLHMLKAAYDKYGQNAMTSISKKDL